MAHNDTTIINIDSTDTAVKMFDKFSRIKGGRRIEPLDITDNIEYLHRNLYNEYNLQIGDTRFMIPPEFIMVNSEATSQSIVLLRQENTQKQKSGHHRRTILIDLVFNGIQQLNGYPVNGPEGVYYVDGLRQLLAQFKCTPFLPIMNETINGTYGIFTVALQSITMSTLDGFPGAMTAQVTLQEINLTPYIEMPDVAFRYMIDWDLFRFYYQRFLTEKHEYRKLQSLPYNREYNRFKISILDSILFESDKATKKNFLNIITDKDVVCTDEKGNVKDSNYVTYIDSDIDNVAISSFQCGYSNILTNIQLADMRTPTIQYIGGMDTIYNIIFETTDYSIVTALEACQIKNDALTRNNIKLRSLGFVKLESELVEFTGSLFVAVESVTTNTVPGFPGLYNVQMNCVSYDIGQSEREQLKGFMPFDGKSGTEHCIDQNWQGLKEKVRQDNYAEWKIRTTMEVYPDLHLPTYGEVNMFISKCNTFRKNNNLNELPYNEYPTNPVAMLHGNRTTNKSISGDLVHPSDIDSSFNEYKVYVDPDFYVFYPNSYESLMEGEEDYYGISPSKRSSFLKTIVTESEPDYSELDIDNSESGGNDDYTGDGTIGNLALQFVKICRSKVGCRYVWGASGPNTFDCSGLATWALKQVGVLKSGRLTSGTISKSSLFVEVKNGKKQPGDLLVRPPRTTVNGKYHEIGHVVIYIGNGKYVEASCKKEGVKESTKTTCFKIYRAKAFIKDAEKNSIAKGVKTIVDVGTSVAKSKSGSKSNWDEYEKLAWNLLKSYGMSDIAAAGAMGNFAVETGNTFDPRTVQGKGHQQADAPIGGKGYGLPQYTYGGYQTGLVAWCKKNNLGCNTSEGQIGYLMSLIKNKSWYKSMNNTSSIDEATTLFEENFEKAGSPDMKKRKEYAKKIYEKYKGTAGTPADVTPTNATQVESKYNLTKEEFDSICKYVYQETLGEPLLAARGVAQYIYDTITGASVGLGAVLSGKRFPKGPYEREVPADVQNEVLDVFKNAKKAHNYKIRDFIDTSMSSNATFKNRNQKYKYTWTRGNHTFWADDKKSKTDKYTIGANSNTDASVSGIEKIEEVKYEAVTLDQNNLQYFAEPVLARVDKMKYGGWGNVGIRWGDDNWGFGKDKQTFSRYELNNGINIFNTSFCNMYNYSGRGRLVRAFPAYLFCILDEESQWFDGRKLWANYYTHKSAIDIAVHGTNDMPTETATITISNSYHNLDVTQGGLSKYKITNDKEYFGNGGKLTDLKKWWYENTGLVPSLTGPKVTKQLIELHSEIYQNAKLREGARVHLRMGYGSDPLGLAPMINGNISDITLGDQITMVVTSDGNELIHHLTSSKQKNKRDTNNGFLGLFGLGEDQEASDIIAKIMTKRQSWMSKLSDNWFEGSMYGIEHFGLYFNSSAWQVDIPKPNLPVIDQISDGLESIANTAGNVAGVVNDVLWAGQKEQYDILKNIYTSGYEREHYITCNWIFDGEENVVFNRYSMTPWDVFQVCTQQAPEYILKSTYHQFDSRLYFGCPMWMEKYRYNLFGGTADVSKVEAVTSNGSGKFNNNATEYDSGKITPSVKGKVTGFSVDIKMGKNYSNRSNTDPDKVTVIIYKDNKTESIELFSGNLKDKKCSLSLDANQISGATAIQIKIHTNASSQKYCKKAEINWSFKIGGEESEDIAKGGDLFDECMSSTQCHFIDSLSCIIDNQVRVTGKFTNTNIKVMYTKGSSVVPTKLLQSDSTIDNAYQKTTIMDSPVVQDALGPDTLYEFIQLYKPGYESAKRIGISNLLYGWQQEYQGQLLLLGEPGIRAHDYIMVNDSYANMYGLSVVREVIHSFNTNTGFTTSVTPGLIGFSTVQQSGLIVASQNMLMLLNLFSAFVLTRRRLIRNYEHTIEMFSNFEVLREKYVGAVAARGLWSTLNTGGHYVKDGLSIAATAIMIKKLKDIKGVIGLASKFMEGYRTAKAAGTGIRVTISAITKGAMSMSGFAGPYAPLMWAGVFILDNIICAIFEWLENKNLVCLLPMWWEDYPFVYNTKDGKKILLMDSNANATEEDRTDVRADAINPDGEFE